MVFSSDDNRRRLLHARKIRKCYTVLDVAAELGVLETFAADYPAIGENWIEE